MSRSIMICLTKEPHSEYAFEWALHNLLNETDRVFLVMVIESKHDSLFASGFGLSTGSLVGVQSNCQIGSELDEITHNHLIQNCKAWLASKEAQILEKFPLLITDTMVICNNCQQHCDTNNTVGHQPTTEEMDVRERIVDVSSRLKPDLIIMGSKAQGKLRRALLGSVSDYCVHYCTSPVLIVKQ